jgi:hypothetical protein
LALQSLHIPDSLDEVSQALHAQPEGFDASIFIAFSAEKSAEHGDLSDDFANR